MRLPPQLRSAYVGITATLVATILVTATLLPHQARGAFSMRASLSDALLEHVPASTCTLWTSVGLEDRTNVLYTAVGRDACPVADGPKHKPHVVDRCREFRPLP